MAKYLDNDGLLYFWQKIKSLFATKDESIKNITRSGTTFTATKADGTSFTFTQQDNNTWNANAVNVAGYVAAPTSSNANKVWKTDSTGAPAWRDDANTTYTAASAAPQMDGTAAVGTSAKYAREDHVHPHDSSKVDVVSGKGLSTNDYTTAEKNKLAGITSGAEPNVNSFGKVQSGDVTYTAASESDTLKLTSADSNTGVAVSSNGMITVSHNPSIFYAECATPKNTSAKVATLANAHGFASGSYLFVRFEDASHGTSLDDVTLKLKDENGNDVTSAANVNIVYTLGDVTSIDIPNWDPDELVLFHYTGTRFEQLSNVDMLFAAYEMAGKAAPKASPTLTGTPKAPTAAAGTNTTQIATTEFVTNAVANKADTNTTYTLTQDSSNGHKITLTPSEGTAMTITIPDNDTKALGSMTGTLGVNHGGTGVTTLGAGVVYHSASGTGALSIASAANLVSAIGNNAVNRATADASGNNIADTYAKKSDIVGMYKYKGSVSSASNLPTTGQTTGDVYNIEAASTYGGAGMNVAWNGTSWDPLGEIFTIASITNGEIDTIIAS